MVYLLQTQSSSQEMLSEEGQEEKQAGDMEMRLILPTKIIRLIQLKSIISLYRGDI